MSGTFSSLSTALSALRHHRVAMDVAGGNVANAGTEGYARRQVVARATGAPAVPAMWSRWTHPSGDGVDSGPVQRMVDPLLDARARTEHARLSSTQLRAAALLRFETALGEPGDNGVAAALDRFRQAWHDVANNPGDAAARSQLLAQAESLRVTVNGQDRALLTEWADQRTRLDALADEVNQVSAQLAELNAGLRSAAVSGSDAGVLLDRRDQLTLRLAQLTGSTVTVNPDTTVEVRLAGEVLVAGSSWTAVAAGGAADLDGAVSDPVTFTVGTVAVTPAAGSVGATLQLLSTDLPAYRAGLDGFVAVLVTAVNDQHAQGADPAGAAGGAFFAGTTAATLTVALSEPDRVAAADPAKGSLDNANALAMAGLDMGGRTYRELVSGYGVAVAAAAQATANQEVMTAQVDSARESLSGISVDEEMVNLLAAQRAYEGAARVLTAVDSMLDTLINRTGLR